jgi:hypothetical protein
MKATDKGPTRTTRMAKQIGSVLAAVLVLGTGVIQTCNPRVTNPKTGDSHCLVRFFDC